MVQEEKMEYDITEDYVSFEAAKLLKEKGFDECIFKFYENNKIKYAYNGKGFRLSELGSDIYYPYITHQMAMKWLREVHNKHCDIGYDIDLKWFFQIIDLKETVGYDYPETKYYHAENESGFNSYEEAVEAALKYSLENLI